MKRLSDCIIRCTLKFGDFGIQDKAKNAFKKICLTPPAGTPSVPRASSANLLIPTHIHKYLTTHLKFVAVGNYS